MGHSFVMLGYFGGKVIESFVIGFNKKLSSLLLVAVALQRLTLSLRRV